MGTAVAEKRYWATVAEVAVVEATSVEAVVVPAVTAPAVGVHPAT